MGQLTGGIESSACACIVGWGGLVSMVSDNLVKGVGDLTRNLGMTMLIRVKYIR